jgi:hypothetical protein
MITKALRLTNKPARIIASVNWNYLAALEERKEQARPEALRRPPAGLTDLLADGGRGEATHAEEPEASGVGDGCGKLGSGIAASKRCGKDRVLDRKITAETGLQRNRILRAPSTSSNGPGIEVLAVVGR